MSLDSRRRRGFQGPKVKELSPKEKRMTEQMKKSGLKQDEVALGYNTTKGLMLEVEEELAKWQKEEEEEEEEEERQVNHSNALLLLNKSFFAAARANWPSGAWSETE